MSRRRTPVPVAAAVEALAARLEPQTPLSRVRRHWPEVVGPAFAPHAQPVAEQAGRVTVECSSSTWAQELELLAPEVVAQLNERLGMPAVRELRVRGPAGRRSR